MAQNEQLVITAQRTPLYELHRENGGSANRWGGLEVPSHYQSILDEHEIAVKSLGLFDLGYRGYIRLQGPDALMVLNELSSVELADMPEGAVWEIPLIYPDGSLVDLVNVAYEEADSYLMVLQNPTARALDWIKQANEGYNCYVDELTMQYSWAGLAGSRAATFFEDLAGSKMKIGSRREFLIEKVAVDIWRLQEDYYEVVCQPELLFKMIYRWWQRKDRPRLCGWASYENWRLERGMLRWGAELKEGVNPYEAALERKIDLTKEHFIGKDALLKAQKNGLNHILIHFYLDALRMPRENSPIYFGGKMVGKVVGGGYSIALKRPIGSAWVSTDVDFDDLELEIRRSRFPLKIKRPPFAL